MVESYRRRTADRYFLSSRKCFSRARFFRATRILKFVRRTFEFLRGERNERTTGEQQLLRYVNLLFFQFINLLKWLDKKNTEPRFQRRKNYFELF